MATLLESYANAKDNDFQKRVTSAIYLAAQQVSAEVKGAKTDTHYRKRQDLAYRIKAQGESLVSQWAMSICSEGLVTKASEDDDIKFTVNAQWDAFSGVTELDKV